MKNDSSKKKISVSYSSEDQKKIDRLKRKFAKKTHGEGLRISAEKKKKVAQTFTVLDANNP